MKWLKFFIGLLLTPLVVAQLWTLKDLTLIWAPTSEWRTLWFGSFCGGFVLFLLIFFTISKTVWLYVLGHELTHAWAVYLSKGNVFDFKVTRRVRQSGYRQLVRRAFALFRPSLYFHLDDGLDFDRFL
ncbi:MAG: hypothetical protein V4507_09160 [Verrucomicrobiota bacterium]